MPCSQTVSVLGATSAEKKRWFHGFHCICCLSDTTGKLRSGVELEILEVVTVTSDTGLATFPPVVVQRLGQLLRCRFNGFRNFTFEEIAKM